jgi:hypothetical protein
MSAPSNRRVRFLALVARSLQVKLERLLCQLLQLFIASITSPYPMRIYSMDRHMQPNLDLSDLGSERHIISVLLPICDTFNLFISPKYLLKRIQQPFAGQDYRTRPEQRIELIETPQKHLVIRRKTNNLQQLHLDYSENLHFTL